MNTITVRLPEVIATQLKAERISQEDLNTFLTGSGVKGNRCEKVVKWTSKRL